MPKNTTKTLFQLLPVFFCFAVMGFVDITGIATNYLKQDFNLSDKVANLLPSMTLIWFLLISIPSAVLMNRIGRKAVVLVSLAVMSVALALPAVGYNAGVMFGAFALLGMGNTILQVSLNPLLKNVVSDGKMTSALSLGQFVKAVISLLGPVLIGMCATKSGNWTIIFYVYAVATVLSLVWLWFTPIPREEAPAEAGSWTAVFTLLKDKYILVCFLVIVMIVGFEICLQTVIPKQLLAGFNMPIEEGGIGCSVYYAAKMAGTFLGAIILARMSSKVFFKWTSGLLVLAFIAYFFPMSQLWQVYALLAIIGLAGANAFAIAFSLAMAHKPESSNDISALMITGVAGGAVLPPVMGLVSDAAGLTASLIIPLAAAIIVLVASFYLYRK